MAHRPVYGNSRVVETARELLHCKMVWVPVQAASGVTSIIQQANISEHSLVVNRIHSMCYVHRSDALEKVFTGLHMAANEISFQACKARSGHHVIAFLYNRVRMRVRYYNRRMKHGVAVSARKAKWHGQALVEYTRLIPVQEL